MIIIRLGGAAFFDRVNKVKATALSLAGLRSRIDRYTGVVDDRQLANEGLSRYHQGPLTLAGEHPSDSRAQTRVQSALTAQIELETA